MYVLGIETSCDETAAAVTYQGEELSNVITTQDIHAAYGGVVPEFASRAHMRQLTLIIQRAFDEAGVNAMDLDGIAVTYGPGLAGSLLVGLNVAKGMSLSLDIPYVGINHIEGHIFAAKADAPLHPFLCLVVSGGHTLLVSVKGIGSYRILGKTVDDAAGEAFDKVAKILGLSYPGGPSIEKASDGGDPDAISFPRALIGDANFNFSFSGLKTAVLYYVHKVPKTELSKQLHDISASFQEAVVDVLVKKTLNAAEKFQLNEIVLAGGVARNRNLRQRLEVECKNHNLGFSVPPPELCTDNALMISRLGYEYLRKGKNSSFQLDPCPSLDLD